MGIIIQVFRRSSMVEQEAVNFEVAGSSPAVGAKKIVRPYGLAFFFDCCYSFLSHVKLQELTIKLSHCAYTSYALDLNKHCLLKKQ